MRAIHSAPKRDGTFCRGRDRAPVNTRLAAACLISIPGIPSTLKRLRTFARRAADRDIIVEVCFYNVMYPQVWDFMPMNAKNNIQGVGECDFSQVQSVANTDLLPYQVEYVREDRPRVERVRQHHLRDHRRAWQLRRPARRIFRLDRPHARRGSRRRSRPQQAALGGTASPGHDRWRWRLLPRSAR